MKILIVDDDDELRALLAFALRNSGLLTVEAADPAAAMEKVESERPSLVVLDLNLGREDGLALLTRIRAKAQMPVLILSVRSTEEDVVRGLDLGADDYLTKPFSPRTLLARVRALLRRAGEMAPSEELAAGPYRLDLERRTLAIAGRPSARLTQLELRLVQALLANAGDVVPTDRLIAHVWGGRGEGDRQLLKQLVRRLRQKIESEPSQPVMLETEAGVGYRLRLDGEAVSSHSSASPGAKLAR